jgi:DNA-binding response OmpR family regulator
MARVLIVENEIAYQKILKDTLEKEKFEVILASDVKQGMADVNNDRPDVILLDIMLPGDMNGFDFLERLKANENTQKIPVIVITNLASEEKVAKEIGASYYFTKSETTIEQIINKVREVVGT